MRAVVGVTDNDWATFLRADDRITEANFWVPSGRAFRGLQPGEPFLFKTKSPTNRLVGGGYFDRFWELPVSEAWATWGIGNGVAAEADLSSKIQSYRSRSQRPFEPDPYIGCIILRNLFFAEPGGDFGPPPDWSPEIVTSKSYDLDSVAGQYVRFAWETMRADPRLDAIYDSDIRLSLVTEDGERYGTEYLTRARLGQGSFRLAVLDAYEDRCAVTGSRIRPALHAAHIRPYASGGLHAIANGLALRSDIHTLFDRGYVGVDGDYQLRVSPRLREDFGNGVDLYAMQERGDLIRLPQASADRPDPAALEWHLEHCFKSA